MTVLFINVVRYELTLGFSSVAVNENGRTLSLGRLWDLRCTEMTRLITSHAIFLTRRPSG